MFSFTGIENAIISSCDKGSSIFSENNTDAIVGYTSLDFACNEDSDIAATQRDAVVKRDVKRPNSTPFQRHSVHQINIANKVITRIRTIT